MTNRRAPSNSATAARGARSPILSQQTIVDCAFDLAEREGVSALSMRRLAEELGVDPTAFYRHFGDKDDLLLAVGDRTTAWALEKIHREVEPGVSWQTVLRTVSAYAWEASERFPAAYSLTFNRTTGQVAEREMVELIISTLAGAGLEPKQAVMAYRTFADTVLALSGVHASVQSMEGKLREKDATAWSRIYAVLPHEMYPATRRHTAELVAVTEAAIFDNAVEMFISAIAHMISTTT